MTMLAPGGDEISADSVIARLSAEQQARIDALMRSIREQDAWAAEDIRDGLTGRPLDAVRELASYPVMPDMGMD